MQQGLDRELDLLVVEAGGEFVELLLGGDYKPVSSTAPDAELLHDGLQVEHLLNVAGDELADLVHDKDQGVAGPSTADELAKLADLKEKGVITEDELRAQKAKLLSG